MLATLAEERLFFWMSRCLNEWPDFSNSHRGIQSSSQIPVLFNHGTFTPLPQGALITCITQPLPIGLLPSRRSSNLVIDATALASRSHALPFTPGIALSHPVVCVGGYLQMTVCFWRWCHRYWNQHMDVPLASSSPKGSTSLAKQFKLLIINGRAHKEQCPGAVRIKDGKACHIVVQESVTWYTSHLNSELWQSLKCLLLQTKNESMQVWYHHSLSTSRWYEEVCLLPL